MFRHVFVLLTALIVSVSSVMADERDDLFSDFASSSVFAKAVDDSNDADSNRRILTGEALRDMLKKSGFDAKVVTARSASARKELEAWAFPVLAEISENEQQVKLILGLAAIKDTKKELPVGKLLSLMNASNDHAAMLAYNTERQRIEIACWLSNRGLTADTVRSEINRLALAAKKTAPIWNDGSTKAEGTSTAKETPPDSKTTSPTPTLTGQWTATRSATEAFAIEFLAESKFNLVYIRDASTTKSSGTFTLANGRLQLKGANNFQLEGKLTTKSKTTFTFEPQGVKPLTFTQAK